MEPEIATGQTYQSSHNLECSRVDRSNSCTNPDFQQDVTRISQRGGGISSQTDAGKASQPDENNAKKKNSV